MNVDLMTKHLNVNQYGDFTLTDAIRPSLDIPVRPRSGYRIDEYRDQYAGLHLQMIHASVSAELLFDVFLDLLTPLGEEVHVVLESSHGQPTDRHADYRRNHIDAPVLTSTLCDFVELLLHDGCTGVSVLSSRRPLEVQFDEHKQFTIYGTNIMPFRRILKANGIPQKSKMRFISEAPHLHHSSTDFEDQFHQLALRIGVTDSDPVLRG
ncbi:MAG: hypothetical protein ACRC8S_08185 [Fimbriiglobus sp.]